MDILPVKNAMAVPPLLVALTGYVGGSQHGHLLAILLKVLIALGAQV